MITAKEARELVTITLLEKEKRNTETAKAICETISKEIILTAEIPLCYYTTERIENSGVRCAVSSILEENGYNIHHNSNCTLTITW